MRNKFIIKYILGILLVVFVTTLIASSVMSASILRVRQGGTATSTLTGGGLLYYNETSITQDIPNLFYDYTNVALGIATTTPLATLNVEGNMLLSGADRYINFNKATSTAGYGIRDNSGTLEYKDDAGSWTAFNTLAGGGGGSGLFTTSSNQLVYPVDTNDSVVIGGNATTSAGIAFEVYGDTQLDGALTVHGTTTIQDLIVTKLDVSASTTLAYASTTKLYVSSEIILPANSIDISGYTNLTVGATGIELSGDDIALTSGYLIPLTASSTQWATSVSWGDHELEGYAYNANVTSTNMGNDDYGDFSCDGTDEGCSLDTSYLALTGGTITGALTVEGTTTIQDIITTQATTTNLSVLTGLSLPDGSIQAGYYVAGSIDGDDIDSGIAGRSLTLTGASPDTLDADAELYTKSISFNQNSSTTLFYHMALTSTITEISCHNPLSTTTLNVEERNEDVPNTTGTDVLTSDIVCSTTYSSSTTFDNAGISADSYLVPVITSKETHSTSTIINVKYTIDD